MLNDRENPENIEAGHADFKDDETIDDRENPESIKEDASDKADDNEPYIQADSDDDVEEEGEAEEEKGEEEYSDDPWCLLKAFEL